MNRNYGKEYTYIHLILSTGRHAVCLLYFTLPQHWCQYSRGYHEHRHVILYRESYLCFT